VSATSITPIEIAAIAPEITSVRIPAALNTPERRRSTLSAGRQAREAGARANPTAAPL